MLNASPKEQPRLAKDSRLALFVGICLWAISAVVVSVLVALHPRSHTVTIDSYHMAAQAWWDRQDLYVGPSGFNYLPHFVILYSPFHFLPFTLSEIVWRLAAALALSFGLWRVASTVFRANKNRAFFWMTLLAMPLSMAALRNGNANAHFGGVILLAIASFLESEWTAAVAWTALAIAIKPLAIVLLGLAFLFYAPVIRRLPAAIIALAVFPFLFGSPSYVWSQEQEAWKNLRACSVVTEHRFADINGILGTFGLALAPNTATIVRAVAGLITAGLWVWGARRLASHAAQVLWLYALAAGYLMVFNPMTEANSYVIMAPAFAVWAAFILLDSESTHRLSGYVFAAMPLSMGLLPNLLRPFFGNNFALIWHPTMTLIFIFMLINVVGRSQPAPETFVEAQARRCV